MILIDKINIYHKTHNTIKIYFTKNYADNKKNFITNIDVFDNAKDIINKIKTELSLKNINYKLITKSFIRDYYYSQIRDDPELIYTEDLIFIDKYKNDNYSLYIFASDKTKQDKLSFPNLNKYHYTIKIDAININIDNIKIIIENNNIFLEIKKNFNEDIYEIILNMLLNTE